MATEKVLSGAERMAQAEEQIAAALAQNQTLFDMVEQCMTVMAKYEQIMRVLINAQSMNSAYDRWEHVKPMLEQLS